MKTSKDGKVKFLEDKHQYWLGEKKLQSVTSFISQFKPKFEKEKIATKYAAKHGREVQDVLDEWTAKNLESVKIGTAVHKIFEDFILTGMYELPGYTKEQAAVKFINDFFASGRLTPVEAEMIVYNDDLAGQIDCVAKNKDGDHFILDWKTNKEISEHGWGRFMLSPFDLFPDANYFHYSLQLAIYRELCPYDIKGTFIIHLEGRNYKIINGANIDLKGVV